MRDDDGEQMLWTGDDKRALPLSHGFTSTTPHLSPIRVSAYTLILRRYSLPNRHAPLLVYYRLVAIFCKGFPNCIGV